MISSCNVYAKKSELLAELMSFIMTMRKYVSHQKLLYEFKFYDLIYFT